MQHQLKIAMPNPKPKSENILVHKIWEEDWKKIDDSAICDISIEKVISKWKNEL